MGANQRLRQRTVWLLIIILVVGFGAVISRLAFLQLVQGEDLQQRAVKQQLSDTIIHDQVQLTEVKQKLAAAQKTLEEQQSLYTQLQMKFDASISTDNVEKYAKERLDMATVANSQKEFISLSEGDKVEIASDSNDNVFDSVADAFSSSGA